MSAKAGEALSPQGAGVRSEPSPFVSRKNLNGWGILNGRIVACLLTPLVVLLTLIYLPFILISSNEFPIWRQKRPGYRGMDILVPKFSTMNMDSSGVLRGDLVRQTGAAHGTRRDPTNPFDRQRRHAVVRAAPLPAAAYQ